jgi:hypothetical protein
MIDFALRLRATREASMPAQLITIATATKKKKKPKKNHDDIPPFRDPPVRPLPIGVLSVSGQEPVKVGHFESVAKLLDTVHTKKILPGRSNTIFATVSNLDDLKSRPVQALLDKLPDELTIVAHEGEIRG